MRRAADPYRDLDVIDARAPRFNQAVIGSLALVAFVADWWWLLALLALQLAVGLTFGRRYCLPCLAYFELVQPRLGEGPVEDSRPPRFANMVGVAVLGAASVLHLVGLETLGWALGLLVAALALLAAATGLCAGCEAYRLGARMRGIRSHRLDDVDLGELRDASSSLLLASGDVAAHGATDQGQVAGAGTNSVVVQFTHPLCSDCRALEARLEAEGRHVLTVDVRQHPDLARKYGIALVPTAVAVAPTGAVVARIA